MTTEQKRRIASAMGDRSKQWLTRLGIVSVIAIALFPLTSPAFAACWIALYAVVQVVEGRLHPDMALARWLGRHYEWVCIATVLAGNVVFGSWAAAQIVLGTAAGMTCAALLISGSIIHTVVGSTASRSIMVAAVAPQIAYATLLPLGAAFIFDDALLAFQMTIAISLLLLSCLAAWSRLAGSFSRMEAAQARAEDANRAKSDFLATISHEIRTPLNGVLGMAQAMAADTLPGRQRERLDVIGQSGLALLTILNDVLDLAKIEARQMELEASPFDLVTLVQRSQETFRAIAESKGLVFDIEIDPTAQGTWRGDTTRLRQILSNLISNAVKFTDEGRVALSVSGSRDGLCFVVEDTGPGVTAEQLPRLFKKFVQADASTTRRYGGTGLGLSICGELAALMGGSIIAEHVRPHGLRFTFNTPLEAVADPAGTDTLSGVSHSNGQRDGARPMRVLAAEDHPVNRQVLTLLLSQVGIIPHIVENGAEALEAWRTGAADGDWDLILMDIQMPVMDGPTAARAIRAEERTSRRSPVPIVALTANVMSHQIEEYREAGMDDFVAKPIQVEALLAAVETARSPANASKVVRAA